MKKLLLLLFFSVLIFGCSNDNDDSSPQLQEFTITLNVDANHSFGSNVVSALAFLSDQYGEILDSGDLIQGQTTALSANADPASIYDLSYVIYKYQIGFNEKTYSIKTFSNVKNGLYNLGP